MKIKSTIHDYFVSFGDYKDFIKETYSNGDIITKSLLILIQMKMKKNTIKFQALLNI